MNRFYVRVFQLLVVAGGAAVVVCSARPWVLVPEGVFNFMYTPGMESGLDIEGALTRPLGWLVGAASVLAVRSRVARVVGFAASAAALVVATEVVVEIQSGSGVAPTDAVLLVVAGGAVSVVGFVVLELGARPQPTPQASRSTES